MSSDSAVSSQRLVYWEDAQDSWERDETLGSLILHPADTVESATGSRASRMALSAAMKQPFVAALVLLPPGIALPTTF